MIVLVWEAQTSAESAIAQRLTHLFERHKWWQCAPLNAGLTTIDVRDILHQVDRQGDAILTRFNEETIELVQSISDIGFWVGVIASGVDDWNAVARQFEVDSVRHIIQFKGERPDGTMGSEG